MNAVSGGNTVRNQTEQEKRAMVLVKKDIQQIMLFRMSDQGQVMIINIMEMTIKNEFADKRDIQDNCINASHTQTQAVASSPHLREKK